MSSSWNYITDNNALNEVVSMIRDENFVALDTEFMREKTYYPVLALIQVAVRSNGKQKLFAIDALSGIDLEPLLAVLLDDQVTKIFHASLQDLQIIFQKSDMPQVKAVSQLATSVIDTQIMANFCGLDFNAGYSNLVETLLQNKIDKTLQRSDWQKRPLSPEQIEYAISDVIFLEEIHQKLAQILAEKNRQKWYKEEMQIFVTKALSETKENLFKNFSFKGRSKEEIARIKNLILWRENWAQKLDLPRQHFMRDYLVERVAYSSDFELNFDEQKIAEIKKILNQDLSDSELTSTRDETNFMSDKQKQIYKKAKELVAEIAREENLKEQLLITSHGLKSLICSKKPIEELLSGWRYELCGERLGNLILK